MIVACSHSPTGDFADPITKLVFGLRLDGSVLASGLILTWGNPIGAIGLLITCVKDCRRGIWDNQLGFLPAVGVLSIYLRISGFLSSFIH